MLRHYDGQRALAHLYLSAPLRTPSPSPAPATFYQHAYTLLLLTFPRVLLRTRSLVYLLARFSPLGSHTRAYTCLCVRVHRGWFAYLHVHVRHSWPSVSIYRQQRRSPRDREEGRKKSKTVKEGEEQAEGKEKNKWKK